MILPTVAVQHPDDPSVRMLINVSDLREDHVRWVDEDQTTTRVGKGPRGKWYVSRGGERIAGPFETEDEAQAASPAL